MHPGQFEDACEVDEQIRLNEIKAGRSNIPYLHKSRKPLRDVVFDAHDSTTIMDAAECEGMCGV